MESYSIIKKGTNFEEFFIVAKSEHAARCILTGVIHDKVENYDIELFGFDARKIDGSPSESFICDYRNIEIWNETDGFSLSPWDVMYNYYKEQITL